jgi:hypothetical protein
MICDEYKLRALLKLFGMKIVYTKPDESQKIILLQLFGLKIAYNSI